MESDSSSVLLPGLGKEGKTTVWNENSTLEGKNQVCFQDMEIKEIKSSLCKTWRGRTWLYLGMWLLIIAFKVQQAKPIQYCKVKKKKIKLKKKKKKNTKNK